MPQPDAPTSLLVGNEETVRPCGLRVSWQSLHDKCSHEMSMVDQAQSLPHGSKVLLNEQMGWHSSNENATPARLLRTYWAEGSQPFKWEVMDKPTRKARMMHVIVDEGWTSY